MRHYQLDDSSEEQPRYRLVEQVIRDAAPVVVQGLSGRTPKLTLKRLAAATGMVCTLGKDRTGHIAAVRGSHGDLAVGLMWRPRCWPHQRACTSMKGRTGGTR
ncbi:hypothetical protein GCM10022251_62910 [Phytohabitans flavus]|uniref:Uncharacterized protein n=1 Tax=Phytohabitans flavus TaxID=1076124 RepID=A0A6F8Y523_9ACTN|nr:hypothetical protein Pflav_076260 [Phytohabitans flavus]